jgi:hypothetical protein
MEALQLEIGCIGCPLSEPFEPMGAIVMHCWLHSFWEVVFTFKLRLEIDYPEINDMTITSVAIQQGFVGNELLSIKHCRLASCSVFLSDVVGANGRHMDPTRCALFPILRVCTSSGTAIRSGLGSLG